MEGEMRPGDGAGEEAGDGGAWFGCIPEIESEDQEASLATGAAEAVAMREKMAELEARDRFFVQSFVLGLLVVGLCFGGSFSVCFQSLIAPRWTYSHGPPISAS